MHLTKLGLSSQMERNGLVPLGGISCESSQDCDNGFDDWHTLWSSTKLLVSSLGMYCCGRRDVIHPI